jgi:hemerythrin superfamily protein
MAHTAIKSPTDVVDFLVSQHQQIKAMFAETLAASGEAREKAFVELRRLLAVHETAEEEIVHPRAKRKIADGTAVVDERLHEEHEAKAALQQLESLDVDSEEFTRELTRLRDAVIDHAEHEERDEFAKLGEELSADELNRMPCRAARRSRRTHPAPRRRGIPGGQSGRGSVRRDARPSPRRHHR